MKNILKFAFAVGLAAAAGAASATAQTVVLDGLGSSAYFLEAGLGANYSGGPINAPCMWSESTSSVVASDTSSGSALTDTGNAWVAWTKGTGGSCASPASGALIYAYLQTDSVVGNRCLFNANLSTPECSIAYPTTDPAPAGLILTGGTTNCGSTGECSLPTTVANALNSATVNFAGSDIRPEDAEFAITRALTNCGTPVATGSQYLGLGYTNGGAIDGYSGAGGSSFNVINFSLPSAYSATIVGATPLVVAVNGSTSGSGFASSSITDISSQALAYFLDGSYSYTAQVTSPTTTSGPGATVYIREPLSGTYNTMEYNVPNRIGSLGGSFATSQDVGLNQPSAQRNCSVTSPWPVPSTSPSTVLSNPMNIATTGGARQRAIGTGKELAAVVANANGNSLGYSFWSVANFKGFTGTGTTAYAKYLTVDSVDPLLKAGTLPTGCLTGVIPTTGTTQLSCVDLHTTANGEYPIWSLLRMVNVGSSPLAAITDLAAATDDFVSFSSTTSRPDFVTPENMQVVRSHFLPPAGSGLPLLSSLSNGTGNLGSGDNVAPDCSGTETGGDVGGVPIGISNYALSQSGLTDDEDFCVSTSDAGQTQYNSSPSRR